MDQNVTGAHLNFEPDLATEARRLEESIRHSWGPPTKWQPKSNNASKAGHPCPFFLWAARARWEDLPAPDVGLMGVFAMGREAETGIKLQLLKEGWKLTHEEVTFEDTGLDIRGRMDWYLSHELHEFWKFIPTEFKSVAASYFDSIQTFDDLFDMPMRWCRLWPYQVLLYAYLAPEERPYVCLLLRNKGNGQPKAMIVKAEDYYHKLMEMGEVLAEVNVALREGTEPIPMTYDPVWCDDCDAAHICPRMQKRSFAGGGPVMIEAPEKIDAMATTYMGATPQKKVADAAWEQLKLHCKHLGLYDGKPGQTLIAIGATHQYQVKQHAKSARLKVTPTVEVATK